MLIYFVSFLVFLSSILVVTSSSPITSVVYLIGTFILTAIYLSSQGMYYIALTYIVVYVGAVITLFLFVVIIINLGTELNTTPFTQTIPLTVVTVILYTILIVSSNSNIFDSSYFNTISTFGAGIFQYLVNPDQIINSVHTENIIIPTHVNEFSRSLISFTGDSATNTINHWNQIQSIGFELYTHQAMYLVLVSIVLIVSMIGPIVICGSARNSTLKSSS